MNDQLEQHRVNELFQFQSAPKKYKKVKVAKVRLVNRTGVDLTHEVPVYLDQAGTPTFVAWVPDEYRNAWENHRSKEYDFSGRDLLRFDGGWLHRSTFDDLIEQLGRLSDNYRRFYESISVKKVIVLGLVLLSPANRISHHNPSFHSCRIMVGIRSDIRWEVNGKLYYDSRRYSFGDEADAVEETEPSYDDLRKTEGRSDESVRIPFTPEAWSTVQDIELTLERAAQMLNSLTKVDTAQALLEGGLSNLLTHSPQETRT